MIWARAPKNPKIRWIFGVPELGLGFQWFSIFLVGSNHQIKSHQILQPGHFFLDLCLQTGLDRNCLVRQWVRKTQQLQAFLPYVEGSV